MMGPQPDIVSDLAPELDRAIADPDHWLVFLERIARIANSKGAILIRVDDVAEATISMSSVEDLTNQYFREGWQTIDHRLAAIPLMRRRGIAVDQDFTTQEQFDRLPFYQDLLARHGLRWFAGIGFQTDRSFWCLSLQRTPQQGLFEPHEQARFSALVPLLRRAAFLSSAVEQARVAGMADALDLLGCAALILDEAGKAVRWNQAFQGLLDDDFRIVRGRLVTEDAAANACIEGIGRAATRHAVPAFVVRRRALPPIAIHVLPLGGEARRTFACGATLLLARTPEVGQAPTATLLRAAYGLTGAEARLAAALAEGESLSEAAHRFEIAVATARTQVKSVFEKTGVARQVDLVRLVLALGLNR